MKIFMSEAEMLRDVINKLKEQNAKLINCCEFTYEKVLQIPWGTEWRIENDFVLANLRNVISDTTGKDCQEVQEHFEEIALKAKLQAGVAK